MAKALHGVSTLSELVEVKFQHVRQVRGGLRRRWFTSADLDLFVWCSKWGIPTSFQLCYDKARAEHALTWSPEIGFVHVAVDDGEGSAGLRHKATPILLPDGKFDAERIRNLFAASSGKIPADVAEFVASKLAHCLASGATT